ncbi:MAG: hypothetical protein EOO80_22075 [Oxalobacteraceae bacterium]|nr:MAG: hypothetical protein EOO80_22075 [Oxalobacteraceae bacterium]
MAASPVEKPRFICSNAPMMNQSPVETALSRALIRWSLTKATPMAETPTSWIFRVEQNGRNFAVLKILKTGKGDAEQRGAGLMEWYGGEGAATVFDSHNGTLFMEWLDGIPLGDAVRQGRDEEASIALATVVSNLHRPRAEPPKDLLPLRQHFAPLFAINSRAWPYTAATSAYPKTSRWSGSTIWKARCTRRRH